MLAALQKPQFAIPEVNLDAGSPGQFPDLDRMVNLMISKGIVPIIITYTYRTDAAFNLLVDQYNTALVQYAQTKKLPLIDFNKEMLLRLPFSQWPGRFLSDGVHYTLGHLDLSADQRSVCERRRCRDAHHRPGPDLRRLRPQGLARRAEDERDQGAGDRYGGAAAPDSGPDRDAERGASLDHAGAVGHVDVEHDRRHVRHD